VYREVKETGDADNYRLPFAQFFASSIAPFCDTKACSPMDETAKTLRDLPVRHGAVKLLHALRSI